MIMTVVDISDVNVKKWRKTNCIHRWP